MSKIITTESWIRRAKTIHPDYEYPNTDYKGCKELVEIFCPKQDHGVFWQIANDHLNGHGCPICGGTKKLTNEEFQRRGKEIQEAKGRKFIYKSEYIDANTKVCLECCQCGNIFWQKPSNHLQGIGCSVCEGNKLKTTEQFIAEAKAIPEFKDKGYIYTKTIYTGANKKIIVICPKHKSFKVTPNSHLHGSGCPDCKKEILRNLYLDTKEDFIKKANNIFIRNKKRYSYEHFVYVNSKIPGLITCPNHGDFSQTPAMHLQGNGCPICANIQNGINHRSNIKEFIEKSKNIFGPDALDYSLAIYVSARDKIILICNKCHTQFKQTVRDHLSGFGCPICNESKGEREIRKYLKRNNIKFVAQKRIDECRNIRTLPFDFAIYKENKLFGLIEFHGMQHYEPIDWFGGEEKFKLQKKLDKIKKDYCDRNNIPLLIIPYTEYNKITKYIRDFIQ